MTSRRIAQTRQWLGLGLLLIISVATFFMISRLDEITSFLGLASGKEAYLIIDAGSDLGELPQTWSHFAQGGESATYSFAPVIPQLQRLKPKYIRLDHIYDFYVDITLTNTNQLIFDWKKLDAVLSEIKQSGATPFLALSYMPPAISRGDITDLPKDWSLWRQTIEATIEHVSGKEGLGLEGVYYEIWNEPDLFGQWKTYGEKNYLTMYEQAHLGARDANNTHVYYFGGPATTKLYPNWVNSLMNMVNQQQLRMDFYSWHLYSAKIEDYRNTLIQYRELMEDFNSVGTIEPLISEWGYASDMHPAYDSPVSAAHGLAALSVMSFDLDKAFSFEIQDGLDPEGNEYWGRWGLMTHQQLGSRLKPRFSMYEWMSKLEGVRINVSGEGDWVKAIAAKGERGTLQVLVTNYDERSRHTETVPISLERLDNVTYTLTKELMGKNPQVTTVSIFNNRFEDQIVMPPNSIVRLTLEPIRATEVVE